MNFFDTCATALHVLLASTVTCPIRCRLPHAHAYGQLSVMSAFSRPALATWKHWEEIAR